MAKVFTLPDDFQAPDFNWEDIEQYKKDWNEFNGDHKFQIKLYKESKMKNFFKKLWNKIFWLSDIGTINENLRHEIDGLTKYKIQAIQSLERLMKENKALKFSLELEKFKRDDKNIFAVIDASFILIFFIF